MMSRMTNKEVKPRLGQPYIGYETHRDPNEKIDPFFI